MSLHVNPIALQFKSQSCGDLGEKQPVTRKEKRLHECVTRGHEELFEIAILTCIVLSVLNGSRPQGIQKSTLLEALRYAPDTMQTLQNLAEEKEISAIRRVSASVFLSMKRKLEFCQRALRLHCADDIQNPVLRDHQIVVLKMYWRDLGAELLICMFELSSVDPEFAGPRLTKKTSPAEVLLTAVRSGEAPCMRNGKPVYPYWLKRRGHMRLGSNQETVVEYRGKCQRAVITNISSGGCRINTHTRLEVGEIVMLALPGKGRLTCRVTRSNGQCAGLAFTSKSLPSTGKRLAA